MTPCIAPRALVPALVIMMATGAVLLPRFARVLGDTRLPDVEAYGDLLATQQLLAGELGWSLPHPLAACAAALSILSSIPAVHVVRLLSLIAGCLLVGALILTVRRATGKLAPALVSAATVGVALFAPAPQGTTSNALGSIFLLLSLFFWYQTRGGAHDQRRAALLCTALVALTAPAFLVLEAVGMALLLAAPWAGLIGIGGSWVILAAVAGSVSVPGFLGVGGSVPAALSVGVCLLSGGVFHLVTEALGSIQGGRAIPRWATASVVVALTALPRTAASQYVEYDVTARKTLEIAADFPRYRWMIVAPIEQLAFTYGRGWYEDLDQFVAVIRDRTADPDLRRRFQVDDVFVFVETHPFATFSAEPAFVPFSVLSDPVFRNYRSPAGRSSLQFAAHEAIEQFRKLHDRPTVYYEDDVLTIYRFDLRERM